MIMEKKNNSLRYVAGACFGIVALIYINGIVQNMQEGYYRSALWTLVSIVGYALIAVSMFASVNILTSAGGGILAVGAARVLISNFGNIATPKIYLIKGFIELVVCILFVVIGLNRKNAKMICIVAGVLLAVRFLLFAIYFAYYGLFLLGFEYFIKGFIGLVVCTLFEVVGLNRKNAKMICIVAGALLAVRFLLGFEYFLSDIANILEIVGIIMMGLALNIDDAQDSSSKTASTSSIHSMTPAESQMDRLAKLKDLLDNGVISQEEFDAKKKQILGQ